MSSYYPYLVSSLPGLTFGMKPPMTFGRFCALSRDLVPAGDFALIASLPSLEAGVCAGIGNGTLRQWVAFQAMVGNELVMMRAARRKIDPAKYLRRDGCPESVHAAHIAVNAYRKTSPLEAERSLDLERWQRLDELAAGHYFDLDTLVVYGLKLLILEKWERITTADAPRLLEAVFARSADR